MSYLIIELETQLLKTGKTSADLIRATGHTPANISKLRNGKIKAIRLKTLLDICDELDCQPGDIIQRVSEKELEELIVERANAEKEHMGLITWENAPNGKIVKTDVSVAKNYLREKELEEMGRIVNASLDMAESMAKRHIPMTMEDWAKRIDKFINLFESPILQDSGKVSAEFAKEFAESEFEKYRIIQDRLFQSDFDRFEDNSLPSLDME